MSLGGIPQQPFAAASSVAGGPIESVISVAAKGMPWLAVAVVVIVASTQVGRLVARWWRCRR